jgi:hypothetical protein
MLVPIAIITQNIPFRLRRLILSAKMAAQLQFPPERRTLVFEFLSTEMAA